MRITLWNKDGQVAHTSAKLEYARRYVHKDNVKRVGLMGNKILFITFKDDGYFQVQYESQEERAASLKRWRNLRGVKQVVE